MKFNQAISSIEAKKLIKTLKSHNKKIVSTNGCFDLLHLGHIKYLEEARALGDFLIVAINSDKSVQKLKGNNRPINPQTDRAAMLLALKSVDAVCVFSENTPVDWILEIEPDIHVKGGDYAPEQLPENKTMKQIGGELKILSFLEGYSSTKVIEKILATS